MRPHDEPHGLCSIDPLSAVVGGIIPALFGGGKKSASTPAPVAPPAPPAPEQAPQPRGNKEGAQSPSFLGSVPVAPQSGGGKTLLGQ